MAAETSMVCYWRKQLKTPFFLEKCSIKFFGPDLLCFALRFCQSHGNEVIRGEFLHQFFEGELLTSRCFQIIFGNFDTLERSACLTLMHITWIEANNGNVYTSTAFWWIDCFRTSFSLEFVAKNCQKLDFRETFWLPCRHFNRLISTNRESNWTSWLPLGWPEKQLTAFEPLLLCRTFFRLRHTLNEYNFFQLFWVSVVCYYDSQRLDENASELCLIINFSIFPVFVQPLARAKVLST